MFEEETVMQKEFEGVWLPKEILNIKNVTFQEKIVLSIICNFCQKNEWCYASNRYLASVLNTTYQRISTVINDLKKKELIIVRFEDKKRILKYNPYKVFITPI